MPVSGLSSPARAWRVLRAAAIALISVALCGLQAGSPASAQPVRGPAPILVTGLDAHDGTIVRDGPLNYLYGTRYGCGFRWGARSRFCGFGVWVAKHPGGRWRFVRNLFDARNGTDPEGVRWQKICGRSGIGCFNPRMVRRADGVWLLAFNAPHDLTRGKANAYYFMGCAGPAGPCGPGAPGGFLVKPVLHMCKGEGDFTIFSDRGHGYIICTTGGTQTFALERLDSTWTHGTGVGLSRVAGLHGVESPGVVQISGSFVLTYSIPNRGYRPTGTGWATATSPLGPWRIRGKSTAQRTCRGQPRTSFYLGSHPYEWIDRWSPGRPNQARAPIVLSPIKRSRAGMKLPCPVPRKHREPAKHRH